MACPCCTGWLSFTSGGPRRGVALEAECPACGAAFCLWGGRLTQVTAARSDRWLSSVPGVGP